jgi:hypothetical protein
MSRAGERPSYWQYRLNLRFSAVLRNKGAPFGREQVQAAGEVRVAAFQPVGDDLSRTVKHCPDAGAFRRRPFRGLAIADLQCSLLAKFPGVRVPGENRRSGGV